MKVLMLYTRLSARILWVAAMAVLVLGLSVAPRPAHGQEAAPAAQQAPAAEGGEAKAAGEAAVKEEGKKSEEEEKAAYINNGPIVKATARALNISDATAGRLFLIINFLIIFFCIAIPVVRLMPRVFRKRSELLREKIEIARKSTEDANTRLSAVEAKLTQLDQEIAGFRAEVEGEMAKDEQRIKASIEEEKIRIVASAEQEVTSAAATAERTLRHFAAGLAIEQAAAQLKLTAETDRALIAEFLSDVESKGGVN